tara:strand:- start:199 stop:582 length:384 start_codon:yes stop_codon:yes gene_type:complete
MKKNPKARIFKTSWINKFANKYHICDAMLATTPELISNKKSCINLGGSVYKCRIARKNQGKSRGYRIYVIHKKKHHFFIVTGFCKSVRKNITPKQETELKEIAPFYYKLTDADINKLLQNNKLIEIE